MVKYGSTLSTFDGSWDLSIGPLSAMAVRIPMLTWMRRFFLAMVLIYMGLLAAQRYSRCFADLVLTLRSLDASACTGAVQWLVADAFSNSYLHHAQPPQHSRSPQHSIHHQLP